MSVLTSTTVEVSAIRLPGDLHGLGVTAWRVRIGDDDLVDAAATIIVGRGGVTAPTVRMVCDEIGHQHSRLALSLLIHHGPRQTRWGMLLEVGGSMPARAGALAAAAGVLHAADMLEVEDLVVPAGVLGYGAVAACAVAAEIAPSMAGMSAILDATERERALRAIEHRADLDEIAHRGRAMARRPAHLYPI